MTTTQEMIAQHSEALANHQQELEAAASRSHAEFLAVAERSPVMSAELVERIEALRGKAD